MLTPLSLARRGIAIGNGDRWRDKIGTDETLERGGVIDVGGRLLLDGLKDMAFTTCDDGMQFLVDFARFCVQTAL